MMARWPAGALILIAGAGCGGDDGAGPADARPVDAATVDVPVVVDAFDDAQACETVTTGYPLAPGVHVAQCSQIAYATNPPTSGEHYPNWAKYKSYPAPIGRPFWVHDLEHGGVVVTYHCPDGCAAELAALDAFLAARPADPLCVAPVRNRFVVAPDPELGPIRFAASAWGFALTSSCFDLPALGAFLDAHYAHGPENLCADGIDPLDPALGLPPNCP